MLTGVVAFGVFYLDRLGLSPRLQFAIQFLLVFLGYVLNPLVQRVLGRDILSAVQLLVLRAVPGKRVRLAEVTVTYEPTTPDPAPVEWAIRHVLGEDITFAGSRFQGHADAEQRVLHVHGRLRTAGEVAELGDEPEDPGAIARVVIHARADTPASKELPGLLDLMDRYMTERSKVLQKKGWAETGRSALVQVKGWRDPVPAVEAYLDAHHEHSPSTTLRIVPTGVEAWGRLDEAARSDIRDVVALYAA